ncbi:phosphatidylinositol glycan class F [Clonorchis sinensis]|uniref:Phosphatidylinositol glycan class F n=1 Tax=Clonorchis sinensis TaxID=79923 RepID=G7YJF6_CLOSI|nr:phosphatidylinositol glycan class F [Clonorchis sinensis]
MRRTLKGLQNPGVHVACDEDLVDLKYADDIFLVFEELVWNQNSRSFSGRTTSGPSCFRHSILVRTTLREGVDYEFLSRGLIDCLLLDEKLYNLITFLRNYSWIYTFRWVTREHISGGLPHYVHPSLEHLPETWATALAQASLQDLKLLVSGSTTNRPWPEELAAFAKSCVQYTLFLAEAIRLPPDCIPSTDHHHLFLNSTSKCVDFISQLESEETCVRMNPKKSHEVRRMASFLDHVLIRFLVDIGSGLGHLPNAVALSKIAKEPNSDLCGIVAVECDTKLHNKAVSQLSQPSVTSDNGLSGLVRRILFRVESSNVDSLQLRLREHFNCFPVLHHTNSEDCDVGYLISGLHCCGDLSEAILRLFITDSSAQMLVLVGCCYHKMNVGRFPWSHVVQRLFMQSSVREEFNTEATFRLACQWSPTSWLQWTAHDSNVHRIRFLYRTMFTCIVSLTARPLPTSDTCPRHHYRFDPTKDTELSSLLTSTDPVSFDLVYPVLVNHLRRNLNLPSLPEEFMALSNSLERLWTLTPGILALQQIIQPLLEMFILADRLWYIRQSVPLRFSGFIRLFRSDVSPRCMALVASK